VASLLAAVVGAVVGVAYRDRLLELTVTVRSSWEAFMAQLTSISDGLSAISSSSSRLADAVRNLAERVTADDTDPAEVQRLAEQAVALADAIDQATSAVEGIEAPEGEVELPDEVVNPVDTGETGTGEGEGGAEGGEAAPDVV
jgi:hypothetical protein